MMRQDVVLVGYGKDTNQTEWMPTVYQLVEGPGDLLLCAVLTLLVAETWRGPKAGGSDSSG